MMKSQRGFSLVRGFLPFEHAIRNLKRRPLRSTLTFAASVLISLLLIATSAFVDSLSSSQIATAPKNTAILVSNSSMDDIIRSAMSPSVAALVAADVRGVLSMDGVPAVSPEIHMGTDLHLAGDSGAYAAVVRGITDRAFLVHDPVTLIEGQMPGPGQALVGKIAADKCGLEREQLAIGETIELEGGKFEISGVFSARGTTLESEIWVSLTELQGLTQRDDCSAVFVKFENAKAMARLELFASRRVDLELKVLSAATYYADLAAYFEPIAKLAWAMAVLIALAALASGANMMVATVQDRTVELATLRTMGFSSLAILVVTLQEVLLLGLLGCVCGALLARVMFDRIAVSLAMSAFEIQVTADSVLTAFLVILLVVLLGTIPALVRILRLPVAAALQERS